MGKLTENFNFAFFGQGTKIPFKGYISSIDPTTAGAGVLIGGSQNTYKSLLGTIQNRFGLKRRGPANSTAAGVISSYEWQTSLGLTRVLRAANGKLQVEYEVDNVITYQDLLTGLTDAESLFSFAPWWDDTNKKDDLIFVNGQQEINMWSGGIARIASAANTTGIIGITAKPNSVNTPYGRSCGGIGYAVGDLLTIAGGNGDAVMEVDSITAATAVATVAINNAGSGYTAGDTVKLGALSNFAIIEVTTVDGSGHATSLTVRATGLGYSVTSAVATTGLSATGTGLTIDILTLGTTIGTWHLKNSGSGYTAGSVASDRHATTGGTGTGATVYIITVYTGRITISGDYSASQLGFAGELPGSDDTNSLVGGTLLVNGVTYSYTALGDDGFSFIGVTPDPSSLTSSDVAVSTVIVSTETTSGNAFTSVFGENFTNDFINVVGNQLHVGCYSSRLIFVATSADYLDFAFTGLRSPGDANLYTLDTNARGITAKAGQQGNVVLFGSQGDSYSVENTIQPVEITSGTFAYIENQTISKQTSSDLSSPLGQDFIDSVGDTIIFLDENNQLRQFGTLRNLNTPVYPILSLDVYTELTQVDFTGGQIRAVADESGETVYLVAPITGTLYLYQIRNKIDEVGNLRAERLWQPPFIVGASRVAVIDAVVYVYSNSNPQMYQLWDTGQFYDDSPSDEPIPYESHATFAYLSGESRAQQIEFDKIYYEGYMTQGTDLYNNVYYEYEGANNILTVTVNKAVNPGKKLARFYSSTAAPSLGDVSLGQVPLGDGVLGRNGYLLPKFRALRNVQPTNVFEFSLDIASYDLYAQWQILTLGVNIQDTSNRPTGIMHVN